MIFTIGNCENYDKALNEGNLFKSKYGSVWKTLDDAIEYFSKSKVYINDREVEGAIYIVDADWENDVINNKLNKPCKIIRKVDRY